MDPQALTLESLDLLLGDLVSPRAHEAALRCEQDVNRLLLERDSLQLRLQLRLDAEATVRPAHALNLKRRHKQVTHTHTHTNRDV